MPVRKLDLPAKDLETAFVACDPSEPLKPGDSRYADFSNLRRNNGILARKREFLAAPANGFHHVCLCGHRGSGKSTNLLSFKEWADDHGFLTLVTEVDEHLGMIDLEFSDLFLLAASEAEAAMTDIGSPLPQEKLRHVVNWFAEITQEDHEEVKSEIGAEVGAQMGGSVPFNLGKIFAKFTAGVKAGSSHATTTRVHLRNSPDRLINLTNSLLDAASSILRENGKPGGLLLIFDNLDRYDPDIVDKVLFRQSNLVRKLHCHSVLTMPIALEYEPRSGSAQDCYGFFAVLPMLSLRDRSMKWQSTVAETPYDEKALEAVRQALSKRLDLALFENDADIDLLIRMSGGCIRDVMHCVALAFSHAGESAQFTSEAVRRSIREMRATYIRRMTPEDYRALGNLAKEGKLPDPKEGQDAGALKRRLLYNRFALEYLNGEDDPWMDVHPLVIETEEFRRAFGA